MKTTKFLLTTILCMAAGGFAFGQTAGDVTFYNNTHDGSFHYDNTNNKLALNISTAPLETLHVNGNICGGLTGRALRINTAYNQLDLGGQNANWCHITTDADRYYFNADIWNSSGLFGAYYNTDLTLFTSTGSYTPVTRMTIQYTTGHVGIGLTTPGAQLTVNEDAIFNEVGGDNNFRVESDDHLALLFADAGEDRVLVNSFDGSSAPNFAFEVLEDRGSSYAANFFNSGNNQSRYGIKIQCGENSPSVYNTFIGFFDGNGTSVGAVVHDPSGPNMAFISDRRLKTNIEDTEQNSLDIINGLRVVDFNWKDRPSAKKVTGFISQEVQEVFPEMVVDGATEEDFLMIVPGKLIPPLVRTAQHHSAALAVKDEEIVALRAELDALKAALTSKGVIDAEDINSTSVTLEDNYQRVVLNQNDPNPFRERTTITYTVPEGAGNASLIIYDIKGQLVKEVAIEQGAGQLEVFASDLSSGTYTYSIVADGNVVDTKKMVVNK